MLGSIRQSFYSARMEPGMSEREDEVISGKEIEEETGLTQDIC